MTRTMLDALYPNNIPADTPLDVLIAAYVGHSDNPNSFAQAQARFPNHHLVTIAARTHWDAQILDVEHGALEPDDYSTMNDWCARQEADGRVPMIYCNTSTWPSVLPHLTHTIDWWAARWTPNTVMPATAKGLQYDGHDGYDISVMADWIQGIDGGSHDPSGGGDPTGDDMFSDTDRQMLINVQAGINRNAEQTFGPTLSGGRNTYYTVDLSYDLLVAIQAQIGLLPANLVAALPTAEAGNVDQIMLVLKSLPDNVVNAIVTRLTAHAADNVTPGA